MIHIYNAGNNTNSSSTAGWKITNDPFPAYRAFGTNHIAFMPFCNGFDENKYSKIIKTQKGTKLIVNCTAEQDQAIYLTHLTGGFRGSFVKEYIHNVEIITMKDSYKHCNPSCSVAFKRPKDNNSKWFAIFKLSGRYYPYYYVFSNEYNETPLIIKDTEEFNSYCDINSYNIES